MSYETLLYRAEDSDSDDHAEQAREPEHDRPADARGDRGRDHPRRR